MGQGSRGEEGCRWASLSSVFATASVVVEEKEEEAGRGGEVEGHVM